MHTKSLWLYGARIVCKADQNCCYRYPPEENKPSAIQLKWQLIWCGFKKIICSKPHNRQWTKKERLCQSHPRSTQATERDISVESLPHIQLWKTPDSDIWGSIRKQMIIMSSWTFTLPLSRDMHFCSKPSSTKHLAHVQTLTWNIHFKTANGTNWATDTMRNYVKNLWINDPKDLKSKRASCL